MKNRERQRENRRMKKKVVCLHNRCAGNKNGFCRVLSTNDFDGKMCPFFKTAEQNEREEKAAIARLVALGRQDLIDKYYSGKDGGVKDGY